MAGRNAHNPTADNAPKAAGMVTVVPGQQPDSGGHNPANNAVKAAGTVTVVPALEAESKEKGNSPGGSCNKENRNPPVDSEKQQANRSLNMAEGNANDPLGIFTKVQDKQSDQSRDQANDAPKAAGMVKVVDQVQQLDASGHNPANNALKAAGMVKEKIKPPGDAENKEKRNPPGDSERKEERNPPGESERKEKRNPPGESGSKEKRNPPGDSESKESDDK